MATFVLVHGMWHGGWCWKKLSPLLAAAGHAVYTPTLTGLGERVHLGHAEVDVDTHVQDVVNLFAYEDLYHAILVGHSFGGTTACLIADRIPDRVAQLVNLDGPLPENGKAFKDLTGFWDVIQRNAIRPDDPWRVQPMAEWTFGVSGADLAWLQSKLTPHPLKAVTTPVNLADPDGHAIPSTYISCVEGQSAAEIAAEAGKFAARGWRYRSLPTGHDAMITMPEALSSILLGLAQASHDSPIGGG